jgi:hypothetical protein
MGTVWLVLRAEVRQRWRALLALAILLGLVGGAVLTAAAGARRTDTAYPRMLAWSRASQVEVVPQGTGRNGYYAALARLPQIESMGTGGIYQAALPSARDTPVQLMASFDGNVGLRVDRVRVLAGRLYDPREGGQAMIDQTMAIAEHLRPGSTVRVLVVPNNPDTNEPDFGEARTLSFLVTAIVAFDPQITIAAGGTSEPTVLVSAPFAATAMASAASYGDEAAVRLRAGASMTGFLAAATALARHYAGTPDRPGTGGKLDVINPADQDAALERSARPQAVALAAFAVLAGLIAFAVLSQLLSRQLVLDAGDFPVLRAIGTTRRALVVLSLIRLAVVTVAGALLAVVIAVAASPLMPIGPARAAEPAPGAEVNLAVVGAGAALIALLPLAVLAYPAWRVAVRAAGPASPAGSGTGAVRPSRLSAAAGRTGSVTGTVGVRMAFEAGHGRTAVPVRSALVGSVIAVAAVIAAVVFGTSLVGLVSTPREYGQNWDAVTNFGFAGISARTAAPVIAKDKAVAQYAGGNYGDVTIRGKAFAAIGLDQPHGGGYLTLLAGRSPSVSGEIALGAQTMHTLGLRLGQMVRVTANHESTATPDLTMPMRIVGIVVLPSFSRGSFAPTDLGAGAVVPASVLSEPNPSTGCTGPVCYNFFLLRYRPGTDAAAQGAKLAAMLTALGCPPGSCAATGDQRPDEIINYTGVRDTPLILGAVLAVLAVGTFAHVLLTSVRRRRHDLAMLKTLGLTRPQLLRVVSWQATALAAVAVAVGVPLGVIAGREAWAFFAHGTGVSARPDVPLTAVLLAIPVTLVLANVIAAWPGAAAARVRPAVALRAE